MNSATLIPQQGQIWKVVAGCEVQIQYLFTAPITFSGTGKFSAGERVRVVADAGSTLPAVVYFLPVRYAELHDQLVPQDIRDTPRYKEYLLSVAAEYFQEHFRFIKNSA